MLTNQSEDMMRENRDEIIVHRGHIQHDDRITTFEHECFNPIWREAGVIPDQYQLIEDGQLYGA